MIHGLQMRTKTYFKNAYYDEICDRSLKKYTYLTLADVLKPYQSNDRHFHNVQHLESIFDYFQKHNSLLLTNDIVVLTTLFHDYSCNPNYTNNERRSAIFFENNWKWSQDIQIMQDVKYCIIDTKNRENRYPICEEFNRADMNILYSEFEDDLLDYEDKIRAEFEHVQYSTYAEARIEFLDSLDIPEIQDNIQIIKRYIQKKLKK
jgi:predicted metal-dependent HD superfamily phosphohydrolase